MHLPLPRTPFHPDPLPRTCQVVAKSCKMVPVMLMGYLVSRKRYTALEYCMAVAITSGAAIFKLNEEADPEQDDRTSTQLIGIVLIVCYMGADSFTSNWQSKVFKQHGVSSMVMMLYANLFSSGFTALGLILDPNPNPIPNPNPNPIPNPSPHPDPKQA